MLISNVPPERARKRRRTSRPTTSRTSRAKTNTRESTNHIHSGITISLLSSGRLVDEAQLRLGAQDRVLVALGLGRLELGARCARIDLRGEERVLAQDRHVVIGHRQEAL